MESQRYVHDGNRMLGNLGEKVVLLIRCSAVGDKCRLVDGHSVVLPQTVEGCLLHGTGDVAEGDGHARDNDASRNEMVVVVASIPKGVGSTMHMGNSLRQDDGVDLVHFPYSLFEQWLHLHQSADRRNLLYRPIIPLDLHDAGFPQESWAQPYFFLLPCRLVEIGRQFFKGTFPRELSCGREVRVIFSSMAPWG